MEQKNNFKKQLAMIKLVPREKKKKKNSEDERLRKKQLEKMTGK